MRDLLTSIFTSEAATELTLPVFLAALGTSLVLGLILSLIYIRTSRGRIPSRSFAITLVLLPSVVTIVIMLIGNNVARAFSLAGAFTIIRFRSVPGNPKDITFVLLSMATGLACGMGFIVYALCSTLTLCVIFAVLEFCGYAKQRTTLHTLKITVPEDLDYRGAFDGVLDKYSKTHNLVKIKTADLGSVFILTYKLSLPDNTDEKAFIDELRVRNGNLTVDLVLDGGGDEYTGGVI